MKKCICLLLSLTLMLSCFSAGINAVAASPEEFSALLSSPDLDAITEAGINELTDASNYPQGAFDQLDALLAVYGDLTQEELDVITAEEYERLVDILYYARLWNDWDAAGRPTDFYSVLMLYSAWSGTAANRYAAAAEQLGRTPDWKRSPAVKPFLDLMDSVTEPYTNADIAAAKEAYAAVDSTAWSLLSRQDPDTVGAAMETYRAVLAAVGPDEQTDNEVDLSAYPAADPGSVKASEKTVGRILSLLSLYGVDAEKELAALPGKIAEGSNIISLMVAVADLNPMLAMFVTPDALAEALARDPKFSGAAEKLNALIDAGHTALIETEEGEDGAVNTVWRADRDPEILFTCADFGFEEGDLYGFIDALGAAMSSITPLIGLLGTFRNTKDTYEGVYRYGKYEELIPLLEALELPVLSSVEFTEAVESTLYTDADGNEYNDEVRAGVNAILTPVADYLTGAFAEDPVGETARLLPRLAWVIDTGMLQNAADSLLERLASFDFSVDLTTDGVWTILEEKLVSGEDAGIDIDKDGEKEALPLTHDTFVSLVQRLAYGAVAAVKTSVSAHNANRLGLDTSVQRTATALLTELAAVARTEKGQAFLAGLIEGSDSSDFIKKLLNRLKDTLAEEGGAEKLVRLIDSPVFVLVLCLLRLIKMLDAVKLPLKSVC